LFRITRTILTSCVIITSDIRKENTSNSGAAVIKGACIVIITNYIFMLATFLSITSINGTIVVVIAIDFLLNTSNQLFTTDSMASIRFSTYKRGIYTTCRLIAGVNGA